MTSFRRYENYTDSGVSWIGKIPTHWDILPFKALFQMSDEKNGKTIVGEMLSVSGSRGVEVKPYEYEEQKRLEKDLIEYRVVRKDQLAVNTMWLNYAGLGVSELEGHMSPAYRAYWISERLHKRYIHYLMRSHIYVEGYTGMMQGVRPNSLQIKNVDFHRFPILVPKFDEQQRIANFLDQKTVEIDEAIAKKQRLIELLEERKAILINQAVTKGLNPDVPMMDSGVEWIGEIPEHWQCKPTKYLARILRGKFTHRPRNDPRMYDGKYPFIQTGNIESKKFITDFQQTLSEAGYKISKEFPSGTLVMTITGSNTGNVAILNFNACFPDSIVGFVPVAGVNLDYLYYLLLQRKVG